MSKNTSSGGMGTLGVLQIIFIVLKCIGVIDWPWMHVLIPLWIELGLIILAALFFVIYWGWHYMKNKW